MNSPQGPVDEPNDEECDARDDDQGTEAGNINIYSLKIEEIASASPRKVCQRHYLKRSGNNTSSKQLTMDLLYYILTNT